jgi:1-acyl-sn-glycerol-3-phosphate acyltransferase
LVLQAIRSMIFYALFFTLTAILAIILGGLSMVGLPGVGWRGVQLWYGGTLFLLRFVVGLKTEVTGAENLPEGGFVIAAKHQSDWDIFALLQYTPRPAFIAKKELLNIPFFGWAARSFGAISVDRGAGGDTLKQLVAGVGKAIDESRQVVIYPEGTRKQPLAEPHFKWGAARIYAGLGNVTVVPVALNSGLFWSRNSLVLWPGVARARILPPIGPGLSMEDFHRQMTETIEAETTKLILTEVDRGIARPISPRLREAIAAARANR